MDQWLNKCHFGDVRDVLRRMIADGVKVQTIVTSPPYWGLRDYGHTGQIGLEATPDAYVAVMVDVFGLCRDVLADDGTMWLNLGDSYASKPNGSIGASTLEGTHAPHAENRRAHAQRKTSLPDGLKHKDLVGIPWMTAFALRAAGWYLRQEIIWHKPNPMPESVTDRCTKAHEYIFLLAKSASYYCDMESIKEQATGQAPGNVNAPKGQAEYEAGDERHRTKAGLAAYAARARSKRDSFKREESKRAEVIPGQTVGTHREERDESAWPLDTRNKRSVWTVATTPYKGAHFATFPVELIEPCVLAGAPAGGIVLDPFFGSGTTGQVAQAMGRRFIGIELNTEYESLQRERLRQPSLSFGEEACLST